MILIHKVLHKILHKVHHKNQKFIIRKKNETDGNDTEVERLTISEIEECTETTQSTQDSCYSWGGVSQEIDIKGEKRELSDDEEEPWWESFKSQSNTPAEKFYSLQTSSQGSSQAQAISSQNDNKSDDQEDKKDDEKISFYLKLGKYKNLNIGNFYFRKVKQII